MTSPFSVSTDWYKDFFTDPVIRFWEAAIPPLATEAEIAFVRRHISVPPATVADVPCGSGRHSLALAKAGFTVTAIDASISALERLRAVRSDLPLKLVHADMLEFDLREPVDALICMGNSIGYFEPDLTQRLLRRFAAALRSGGRLIVDTGICAESLLPIQPERRFDFAGSSYQQEISYDAFRSTVNTRALLTLDGESHELRYRHFVMTSGELVRRLMGEGFDVTAIYGDTDDTRFVLGSPRLLLVAVKT